MAKPRILRMPALALAATVLVLSCLPEDGSARELRRYRRPWRSGIVSIGMQGQYGYDTGGTGRTDPFDWGLGLAVSVRYVASKRYSLGGRFEVHNYDSMEPSVEAEKIGVGGHDPGEKIPIDLLRIITAGLDLYVYLNRGTDTMRYFNFGSGLYQLAILQPEDPTFVSAGSAVIERDHIYLMGGAGLEHFMRRSLALDVNGKVFAYMGDEDGIPLGIQVAVGLHYYFFD